MVPDVVQLRKALHAYKKNKNSPLFELPHVHMLSLAPPSRRRGTIKNCARRPFPTQNSRNYAHSKKHGCIPRSKRKIRGATRLVISVRDIAQILIAIASREPYPKIGASWTSSFLRRNPLVLTLVGKPIDTCRVKKVTRDLIKAYCTRLRNTINEDEIQPCNVWNFDETGLGISYITNLEVIWDTWKAKRGSAILKSPLNGGHDVREWAK